MGLEGRHVVVAGGGIGGTATALIAARAGARVTLLEQFRGPRTAGTGIVLQPNALAVLYGLDLDERLQRRGARVTSLRLANSQGRLIVDVPVPRFADMLDHALVVRRGELLTALFDLVAAEPRIECRFGASVREASPDGEVLYGSPAGEQRLTADLVVGADGAHSAIRRHSGLPAHVGPGLHYVRGLGPALPLGSVLTEYWTKLGIFGVAPLRDGCYFYASAEAKPLAHALSTGDVTLFRDTWQRELPLAGEVLGQTTTIDELVSTFVVRVDCQTWSNGRIVLLGDAAHAMAPNLGQGAGSALADAAVLVWELSRPGDTAAALARYEARRRPAVHAVQDMAGVLGRLSEINPAALRLARDVSLHWLSPWLLGEVGMRLVEQQDPLWLRLATTNPTEDLGL